MSNTWALSESAGIGSPTHPPSINRLVNVWFLPLRLKKRFPHFAGELEALDVEIAGLFLKLMKLDESFVRLGVAPVEDGAGRYSRMMKRLDDQRLLTELQKVHEHGFDPGSMPIAEEAQKKMAGSWPDDAGREQGARSSGESDVIRGPVFRKPQLAFFLEPSIPFIRV
jgi:hypothetical protein